MLRPGPISFLITACALLLPWGATAVMPRAGSPRGQPAWGARAGSPRGQPARGVRLSFRAAISTATNEQEPQGQIIEKVVCANNAAQSYALYLPSSYSPTGKWPILYAFDPGARGKIPLERFKEAAEKYGWIVVGSNNSRNGPPQPSADA